MTVNAPAKINIALDITGKRPDGYHELLMIMHEIPLYDTVTVEKDSKISVSGNKPHIPYNEKISHTKRRRNFSLTQKSFGRRKIYLEKIYRMAQVWEEEALTGGGYKVVKQAFTAPVFP